MKSALDVIAGNGRWAVENSDVMAFLKTLPDECAHMCVTSPPYYALRDYGTGRWEGGSAECDHLNGFDRSDNGNRDHRGMPYDSPAKQPKQYRGTCKKCGAVRVDDQLGLEKTPEEYVSKIVVVFREVRRVLRKDGTLWLNIGDSYGKEKQLIGIPWMLAFALRADGWTLRQDIIWHKPAPMPESATDRCTKAHEYLFLLSKSKNYYYDNEAIKDSARVPEGPGTAPKKYTSESASSFIGGNHNGETLAKARDTANKRSVWTVSADGTTEAHFAVMPSRLAEPCVKAGTSQEGVCALCGAPWTRVIDSQRVPTRPGTDTKVKDAGALAEGNRDPQRHVTNYKTIGWEKSCKCETDEKVPALVLEPFVGSGTTLAVAMCLKRRAIGSELNPEYAEMARKRVAASARRPGMGLSI